jgi:uncharacterized protein YigE (DUF2233 family)
VIRIRNRVPRRLIPVLINCAIIPFLLLCPAEATDRDPVEVIGPVEVVPGVMFQKQYRMERHGPNVVNILRVEHTPQVRLSIGLAKGRSVGLEPLSETARREGAVAAVNGTFINSSGLPLGLLVDKGVLISAPVHERTAFVVLTDGTGGFERVSLRMWLQLADGSSLPVHGVNRPAKDGECVVYNVAFGSQTPAYRSELLLQEGVVIARGFGGTGLIPGLVVVSGDPSEQLDTLEPGEPCRLMWELHLAESDVVIPGEEVWFALGGGPRLVTQGEITVTSDEEHFRPDVSQGRAPRTAMGCTAEGTVLLVTVDGRRPGFSVGMTLEELAGLMIELGAVEAMNLDGGASTTMVVGDQVVNIPSNGNERALGTALLVMFEASDVAEALEGDNHGSIE